MSLSVLATKSQSGGATLTLITGAPVAVGQLLIVSYVGRANTPTVSDDSSQSGSANVYIKDKEQIRSANANAAIFSCVVTRSLLATDTVTVSLANPGGIESAILYLETSPSANPFDQQAGQGQINNTSFTSTAAPTTSQANEILIGCSGGAGTSVDRSATLDSPWSEDFEATVGTQSAVFGSRLVSTTGAYAFSGAWNASYDNDNCSVIATYKIQVATKPSDDAPIGFVGYGAC